MSATSDLIAPLRNRWTTLSPRDQRLVGIAAAVLGAYLLWALALAPALATLRRVPAQQVALDQQWQHMQRLSAEAQQLRGAVPVPPAQAAQAVVAATARMGAAAKLNLQGDRGVLTLQSASAPQISAWLAEVRAGARGRVSDAVLTQAGPGLYSGSLSLVIGGGP